jgi:hypothetical protein
MDIDEFLQAWSAVFLPELIVPEALLAALKQKYPLILVSNINESHALTLPGSIRCSTTSTTRSSLTKSAR